MENGKDHTGKCVAVLSEKFSQVIEERYAVAENNNPANQVMSVSWNEKLFPEMYGNKGEMGLKKPINRFHGRTAANFSWTALVLDYTFSSLTSLNRLISVSFKAWAERTFQLYVLIIIN